MDLFGQLSVLCMRQHSTLLILLLCACGTSDENPLATTPSLPRPSFKLEDALAMPVTSASAMPKGTATYGGTALYSRSTGSPSEIILSPDLQSDVSLQANFGSMVLTGKLDGFKTMSGSLIPGSLTANASVAGSRISGSIDGTITQSGLPQTFNGQIDGNFRGQTGEFVAGEVQMTSGQVDFYGLFGAQINGE